MSNIQSSSEQPEEQAGGAGRSQKGPLLIYGYGNPGRQDDGLGIALVEEMEAWAKTNRISGLAFDSNYQLNAEDAYSVAEAREVVFIDATREGEEPFTFRPLEPCAEIAFSTHAMSPESVLALAAELYEMHPPAWMLAIRGFEWEPNGPPTAAAAAHLASAGTFLKEWIGNGPAGPPKDAPEYRPVQLDNPCDHGSARAI